MLPTSRAGLRCTRIAVLALLPLALAATAKADRLVAKGTTLTGSAKAITPAGVEFQPEFAKDPMLVPWENVDDLATDASYQVLYGDDSETIAPITGYRDGKLLVGELEVEPKALVSTVAMGDGGPTFLDRTRSTWRYWHGNVDLGVNVQQATTDTFGALVAFRTQRSTDRTRLIFGADYRYGTQKQKGSDDEVVKDTASGLVRGEYDFTDRVFGYASTDLLYDAVQSLSLRAVPKAGAGYVVWEREPAEGLRDFFSVEAGGGWVYEKFFPDDHDGDPLTPQIHDENNYFTIALGAAAAVQLPRGAAFDWRFDYLPSVSDWSDYVVRTNAGLSVPLIAPVSARLSVGDTYDSTPSGDADENSLYIDTTLSVGW